AYLVIASAMALLVAYEVVLPQPHLGISTSLSELQPDVGLGVMITWLVVIHSFGMVTNGALLFNSVPALATMGLIGSTNLNAEVPILFGLFLFATIFMVAYDQHLQRVALARLSPWPLFWHVGTATVLFVMALGAGTLFGMTGAQALGRLSPYTAAGLSQMQAATSNFVTPTASTNNP